MPTNANTFNSRVTSEALEKKFRDVFPAQGGAELVQDLFASGVITPIIDFSSVAEGSSLPQNLQTAWDFATQHNFQSGTGSATLINNTGFWKIDLNVSARSNAEVFTLAITDGLTSKTIFQFNMNAAGAGTDVENTAQDSFVVFLRTGDSVTIAQTGTAVASNVNWRQIADVNGNLVNPLGFVFS